MAAVNNLQRMTKPQLTQYAKTRGIGGYSKLSKNNLVTLIRSRISTPVKKIDDNGNASQMKYILKSAFVAETKAEAEEDATAVATELTGDDEEDEDASDILISLIPENKRDAFRRTWKDFLAQQVLNGSFLEFQGMRFVRDAEVFDAARNTDRDGRDVFKHIVAPAEEPRVYLKCKFSLAQGVNDDTSRVAGPGTPTWAELFGKSKGKVHCEPDLIVRTKTAIKIYELKMGLGKPESNTEPKEYHQLLRARHRFRKYLTEPEFAEFSGIPIELYFVGWSASSPTAVVFGRPTWEEAIPPNLRVTKINGAEMARTGIPINAALVTKIIKLLNIQKTVALYHQLQPYMSSWGVGRPEINSAINNATRYINSQAPLYGKAISQPPSAIVTRAKATAALRKAAQTEKGLRGRSGAVFQMARGAASRVGGAAVSGLRSLSGMLFSANGRQLTPNQARQAANQGNRIYSVTPQESRARATHVLRQGRAANLANLSEQEVQNLPYKYKLAKNKVPQSIINAALSNAENFGITYQKFLERHGPENAAALNRILQTPPAHRQANFANKLAKKAVINGRAGRRPASYF
jgi:hypothetical protein